jgi:hypothetical protein
MAANITLIDGHPPFAPYAAFDCKEWEQCLEGTRTSILDQIYHWIGIEDREQADSVLDNSPDDQGSQATNIQDQTILWINGSAGTGKTTIATTVAKACRMHQILAASFFCSRDDADSSNPNLIFTTIAYQLGIFCPAFKDEVAKVLKARPDIGYAIPSSQLEDLIIGPLHSLGDSFPRGVIVIDALDKCKDSGTTSIILSSLSLHASNLSRIKIFVTSRPEHNITTAFQSSSLYLLTKRVILHAIHLLPDVQNDIKHYLTLNLVRVRHSYGLQDVWPGAGDIHLLAQRSSGLFIFAATSVRYIEDQNYCNPRKQLSDLLENTFINRMRESHPQYGLDHLYIQVLEKACPNISNTFSSQIKMVLGSISILQDMLFPLSLELLMRLKPDTVCETLLYLHSVVLVPEDVSEVVCLLHPSFSDFITDPTRCTNVKFTVNPVAQHTLLARACLKNLGGLTQDMCHIGNPSLLNNKIPDLSARVMKCIPSHLLYSCRHWAFHFSKGMVSEDLLELLNKFCNSHLLHWLEVCSIIGELRSALFSIKLVQQTLMVMHVYPFPQ